MVKGVFDELSKPSPKNHFTIGINDDVSHSSLDYDPEFSTEDPKTVRALFYGLGSDGTVGANKNSIKIIGTRDAELRAGLLRLRLEEVRLDDHLAPALRAQPDPLHLPDHARQLRGLPQLQLPREDGRAGSGDAGRGVPAQLALLRGRGVGQAAAHHAGRDAAQEDRVLRDRRLQGGARSRHGHAHQHHHADLLLRHQRRAAARRSHRADQEVDQEDLWQARRSGGPEELCRRGSRAGASRESRAARGGVVDFDLTGAFSDKAPEFVHDVLGRSPRARAT